MTLQDQHSKECTNLNDHSATEICICKVHYIGMAGLSGCLPNYCDVFESYDDAVDSLSAIHELGRTRTAKLRRDSYLDLNLHKDGNEYAEVVECECDSPQDHSDGGG